MNRLATENDIAQIGAKYGDVIIDTPDAKNTVTYYFIGKQWPMLTGEPTFWFDGNKLGYLEQIRLQDTVDELPWPVDSVIFRNIPGTTVKFKNISIKGLKNCKINGLSEGIFNWPKERKFLTGSFGFHAIQTAPGGHGFDISVQSEGSIKMEGFEAQFGFDNLRLQQKNKACEVSLYLSEFYLHDTYRGEGIYAGSTQTPPIPKFKHVTIKNGIIARAAAEALQLQNMAGSDISNLTIYAADTAWLGSFQPYQDTGIQFKANGSINRFRNSIVDGFGKIGFNAFSVTDYNPEDNNQILVEDVLFYNGRGIGAYFNTDCINELEWRFKNVHFGGFNNSYYKDTGNKLKSYVLSGSNKVTDKIILERVSYDGTKLSFLDPAFKATVEELYMANIPAPKYVNSGFPEGPSQIMQWRQFYAPYFEGVNNTPVKYYAGEIAIDTLNGYDFYKCISEHVASEKTPYNDPTHWEWLTWDKNGIRSDQKDFGEIYSNIPPDDLRLVGTQWSHMGIQVREQILEEYYINGKRITITNLNRYES